MAQPADPVSEKERRLGGLSLIILAAAAVGPFFGTLSMATVKSSGPFAGFDPLVVAIVFRVVLLLIALVLGIFGRRSRAGRFGLIGSATVLAIGLVLVGFLFSRPAVPPRPAAPTTLPSP
jgi:hypothetical protein